MGKTKKGKWTDKDLEKAYYNGCRDTREEFNNKLEQLKQDIDNRITLMKILILSCKYNDMIEKKEANSLFITQLIILKEKIEELKGK